MAFRDDREALRAKGEVLESEVASLREELERTKRDLEAQETKDEKDEKELARLRKELARLGAASAAPSPRSASGGEDATRRTRLIAIAAASSLAVVVSVWLAVYPESEPQAENRGIAMPEPTATPEATPTAEPNGLDAAQFGAVVTESTGEGPAVGDGCVLDAELRAGGDVGHVRVFCATVLYDSEASAGIEVTTQPWSFVEVEVGPGERVYSLRYRDTGSRTGARPEIVVDTASGEIRVTRAAGTGAPAFTALLRVEAWSTPRFGGALAAETTPAPPAPTPAPVPERCELSGSWEGRLRTPDGEGAGLALAPSQTTSTTVMRNGRIVTREQVGSEPMWWSPHSGPSDATIALACEDGRGTITAADGAWEGRFGPDGATFLGHRSGVDGPAAFWLRRLGADEPSTVPTTNVNVDVNAIVEQALGHRAGTAAPPTGTAVR